MTKSHPWCLNNVITFFFLKLFAKKCLTLLDRLCTRVYSEPFSFLTKRCCEQTQTDVLMDTTVQSHNKCNLALITDRKRREKWAPRTFHVGLFLFCLKPCGRLIVNCNRVVCTETKTSAPSTRCVFLVSVALPTCCSLLWDDSSSSSLCFPKSFLKMHTTSYCTAVRKCCAYWLNETHLICPLWWHYQKQTNGFKSFLLWFDQ